MKQLSLWESERLTLRDAIDISLASLREYGSRYDHWIIAYSGGKDSSATVGFVLWAIRTGQIAAPKSLAVLYADTRQELPPLYQNAISLLSKVRDAGYIANSVLPPIEDRFYVYILGYGVGWPKQHFRWCTERIKVKPINNEIERLRGEAGALTITGVRLGESAARDQAIAISCSKDSGECGQGWFQQSRDSLAPLLHWRLCHIWDWLYFGEHGLPELANVATIYGDEDQRTGCIGCHLVTEDRPLHAIVRRPEWRHLSPLLEIEDLQIEMQKPKWRLRQDGNQRLKNGALPKNAQRLGPMTMEGREYALEKLLDIQKRAGVDLINRGEEAAIRAMWRANLWPKGWTGNEPRGDQQMIRRTVSGDTMHEQPILIKI